MGPTWAVTEIRVITLTGGTEVELPSEISISFRGVPLTVLRKTTLKVWNTGTQAIRGSDVARQIRMTLPTDALVFTEAVARQSAPENEINVTQLESTPNVIEVRFHYLEVRQGFNVEALYTGPDTLPSVAAIVINMRSDMLNVDTALSSDFLGGLAFFATIIIFFLSFAFLEIFTQILPMSFTSFWWAVSPLRALSR